MVIITCKNHCFFRLGLFGLEVKAEIFCTPKNTQKGTNSMKMKKLLSVILAVLMLVTCFSSSLTAFAASDKVIAAENLINSFSADMTTVDVKAEDLEAYNRMVSAFNALSQEEIDELDVFAFDKLLLAVYDREMALWKQAIRLVHG